MQIFRITSEKYAGAFTASGVENRWNKRGEYVIYAGASRSLATLELMVHRSAIQTHTPYVVNVIEIPDQPNVVALQNFQDLPENWRTLRAYGALQTIGSNWYHSLDAPILRVPSAVIVKEENYIINTMHPDFSEVAKIVDVEPFFWDERLITTDKSI